MIMIMIHYIVIISYYDENNYHLSWWLWLWFTVVIMSYYDNDYHF